MVADEKIKVWVAVKLRQRDRPDDRLRRSIQYALR
jgi:hypothetical protein